jgi:hypothetical protein
MVTTSRPAEELAEAESDELLPQLNTGNSISAMGDPLVLRLPPQMRLTNDALSELFELNEPLTFERTAEGDLVIVPLPKGPSPAIGAEIVY